MQVQDALLRTATGIQSAMGLSGAHAERVAENADVLSRAGRAVTDPVVARVLADPQKRANVLTALRGIVGFDLGGRSAAQSPAERPA